MSLSRRTKSVIIGLSFLGFSFSHYASNKKEDPTDRRIVLPASFSPKFAMNETDFLTYCLENPSQIYQDIFFQGKTQFQGINICDARYELLKPIFTIYQDCRFSLLDVGAAQGYFSFRIATDFPNSECTLIEHSNTEYDHHDRMLYQLCLLNGLPNIVFLHQKIDLQVLNDLNVIEHFDIVLALLVVHQIDPSMEIRKLALESLLNLGDQVIIEIPNDIDMELRTYIKDYLSKSDTYECTYLGELYRNYNPQTAYDGWYPNGKGEFYWFRKKNVYSRPHKTTGRVDPFTYLYMKGIYPY